MLRPVFRSAGSIPVRSALAPAVLALIAPLQSGAEKIERRSLLDAAPAHAVLTLTIEDWPRLRSQADSSAWAELLRAPAFDGLRSKVQVALEQDEAQRLISVLDATESVLLYAEGLEDIQQVPWAFALRLRSDAERARQRIQPELDGMPESLTRDEREVHLSHDGVNWKGAVWWSEGVAATWVPTREGAVDQVLALAQRLERGAAEDSLAARLGERRSTSAGAIELVLDLGALARQNRSTLEESDRALWDALGLAEMGWLTVRSALGDGVQLEVLTSLDLPSSGLLSRWATFTRPVPVELAALAPADAVEVDVFGFDVASLWREVRQLVSKSHPDAANKLQLGLEAASASLGVDLERDGINALTGEFAEICLPIGPKWTDAAPATVGALSSGALALSGMPGTSPGSALIVGLRETEGVERLLEALVELSGQGEHLEDEEIAGQWMSSVDLPDVGMRPSWSFLQGKLVISLYAEPVRAVLEQSAEGAAPGWLAAEAHRQALVASDEHFYASAGDIPAFINSQILSPLQSIWAIPALAYVMQAALGIHDESLVDDLTAARDAVPALVEKHLRGTMHSSMWIEGNSLRHRFWTR